MKAEVRSESKDANRKKNAFDGKYYKIMDGNVKQLINDVAKPPSGATSYFFWKSNENDVWGLTVKQMLDKAGKNNSSTHVWKVSW